MKLYQSLVSLFFMCIGICVSQYFIDGLSSIAFTKCFFTFIGGLFIHWMWATNK